MKEYHILIRVIHQKQYKADFIDNAPYIMGLIMKEEELVEHMMDGLRKAGMAL